MGQKYIPFYTRHERAVRSLCVSEAVLCIKISVKAAAAAISDSKKEASRTIGHFKGPKRVEATRLIFDVLADGSGLGRYQSASQGESFWHGLRVGAGSERLLRPSARDHWGLVGIVLLTVRTTNFNKVQQGFESGRDQGVGHLGHPGRIPNPI